MEAVITGVTEEIHATECCLIEADEESARAAIHFEEAEEYSGIVKGATLLILNSAAVLRRDAVDMQRTIDGPMPSVMEAHENAVAYLDALHERCSILEAQIDVEAERLNEERLQTNEYLARIEPEIDQMIRLAEEEDEQNVYVTRRAEWLGFIDAFPVVMNASTAEREAAFRDMVHDMHSAIDGSDDVDATIAHVLDKRSARVEAAIREANEFAKQLSEAFDVERTTLAATYRLECAKNGELRHHLHRGTHNPKLTQITEHEKRLRDRVAELTDELKRVADEADLMRRETSDIRRRIQLADEKMRTDAHDYVLAQQSRKGEAARIARLKTALVTEHHRWLDTKHELEVLSKYMRLGGIPDSAVQARWKTERNAVARRGIRPMPGLKEPAATTSNGGGGRILEDSPNSCGGLSSVGWGGSESHTPQQQHETGSQCGLLGSDVRQ